MRYNQRTSIKFMKLNKCESFGEVSFSATRELVFCEIIFARLRSTIVFHNPEFSLHNCSTCVSLPIHETLPKNLNNFGS